MAPSATIIVPVLNGERTIRKCIESLLNQEHDGAYDIIVVDNGSSDRTPHMLEAFKKNITVLEERSRGSYRARNRGIREARGSIIAFTDADCVALRGWLRNMTAPFRDGRVMVVGGAVQGGRRQTAVSSYCGKFLMDQEAMMDAPSPYFATANVAVRAGAFGKYGLFRESLSSGGDAEWCGRLPRKDMFRFSKDAVVMHHHPESFLKFVGKQYGYGRGAGAMQRRRKGRFSVRVPGPVEMLRQHGVAFFALRVVQELSFSAGFCSEKAAQRFHVPGRAAPTG